MRFAKKSDAHNFLSDLGLEFNHDFYVGDPGITREYWWFNDGKPEPMVDHAATITGFRGEYFMVSLFGRARDGLGLGDQA